MKEKSEIKKPYVIGKFETWRELANLILTEVPEDL